MCEWLERYHTGTMQQHCTRLEEQIKLRLFPPCIQLRLTYAKDPTMWTCNQNVFLLVKSIMAPTDYIQFPLQVKIPDKGKKRYVHATGFCMNVVGTVSSCRDC